jgi:N-acetyllactosaminide beta-1,3-N-acetylglucosaminyltransferase
MIISIIPVIWLMYDSQQSVSLKNHLHHQDELQHSHGSSDALNPEKTLDRLLLSNPSILNVNFSLAQWDTRCLYKFLDSVLSGDKFTELSEKYTVSIATQSSLEKLHSLAEVSEHWTGPISVSVFVASEEFLLTKLYIAYLRQCFIQVRDQISFHLAYPRDYPPLSYSNSTLNYEYSCENPKAVLSELLKHRNPKTIELKNKLLYPQNHLRNQARRNCKTPNIFLTDVDIIPSIGMTDTLDAFLRKSKCEKLCAYVIPVYEISENASFPQNKSEMIKLANNGLARPFHQKIYANGHGSTNYNR